MNEVPWAGQVHAALAGIDKIAHIQKEMTRPNAAITAALEMMQAASRATGDLSDLFSKREEQATSASVLGKKLNELSYSSVAEMVSAASPLSSRLENLTFIDAVASLRVEAVTLADAGRSSEASVLSDVTETAAAVVEKPTLEHVVQAVNGLSAQLEEYEQKRQDERVEDSRRTDRERDEERVYALLLVFLAVYATWLLQVLT